jgi:GntR family transcriptional repressor for pyruvate dehydrogenase complex
MRRLLTTTGEDVESLVHRAECDYAFHLLLAESTHNFIYVNIIKMTFNLIMATHERIYTLLDDKQVFLQEHEMVYDAIIARNHSLAADITTRHIDRVYKTLLNALASE